jgi:hypothetical protein
MFPTPLITAINSNELGRLLGATTVSLTTLARMTLGDNKNVKPSIAILELE